MTFLQHDVFRETSYQRNIISKTLEAGRELRRTGIKQDGKQARWENLKLGKNLNFGIMKFFEEARGSGNIFHLGQKYFRVYEKYSDHQNGSEKIFGVNCGSEIYRKDRNQTNGPRSSRWLVAWVQNVVSAIWQAECLQKHEVSSYMEAVHAAWHVEAPREGSV